MRQFLGPSISCQLFNYGHPPLIHARRFAPSPQEWSANPDRLAGEHPGDIHLLLTDMVLPEMNGRDLHQHLVTQRPRIKSLFTTGYTTSIHAPHGVLTPGVHFLQKPFSMKGLAAKVREAIEA